MRSYSDEDILRFVEGDFTEKQTAQLKSDCLQDSELKQRVDAMYASQLPYASAYDLNPAPPLPAHLKQTINTWSGVARNAPTQTMQASNSRWKQVSVAAAVIGSFILGYGSAYLKPTDFESTKASTELTAQAISDVAWVERVANYQSLYVPETVANIKDGEQQANALLAHLESSTDLVTDIPDLSQFGYTFIRAQHLGFNEEPLLQLIYTRPGKNPLALCYMPSKGEKTSTITTAQHEALGTASWRSATQRYVIVADENTKNIKAIANHARQVFL